MESKYPFRRRLWVALAAGLAVLAITWLIWQGVTSREQALLERVLELEAASAAKRLESQIDSQVLSLVRMAYRWEYWGHTLKAEWTADAGHHIKHFPHYEAIAWVDAQGQPQWIAPEERTAAWRAQGLVDTEEARRAFELARERMKTVVSHPFQLPHQQQPGFLVAVPLVSNGTFDGFIAGVFNIERLLDDLLQEDIARGHTLSVWYRGQPLYRRSLEADESPSTAVAHAEVDLDGQRWRVRVQPTRQLIAQQRWWPAEVILAVGLLTAALLAVAVYSGQTAWALNETLEARVAQRTREAETRTAQLMRTTSALHEEIGERRRTEQELRDAKEAAESASRAKSAFLATMSHEIRTPLNAVIGMTELLLETRLNSEQQDYLRMIHESGEALLAVINDILDFSKIEAGRLEMEQLVFDHAEVLGDTMKSLGLRAHAKGLELLCHIAPDAPPLLRGDPGRLRQVLVNLVGNAIKFTDQGEVAVDAKVEQQADGTVTMHYTVSDTGIGIPEEKLSRIFEAFEQVDMTVARRYGGTGLGLAISSRLVEMMGGRIWVESQVGQGTAFHFTARFEIPQEQAMLRRPADACQLAGLPVLIVDDNYRNRQILHELLRTWGLQPAMAADGREALRILHRRQQEGDPFRVVLTDAHMPAMDGFELAERIRREPKLAGTVVMMLSSGGRAGEIQRCQELGLGAYLIKPVKQSELFDALRLALGMASETPETQAEAAASPKRLRILLAEDSPVNQKLALALLKRQGHDVVVANNGLEAVEKAKAEPFDAILMDVQMPELDGLEATRRIRSAERQSGSHVPIIAMTAYALKGDRESCLEAGMDGYIAKPIRAPELMQMLADVTADAAAANDVEPPPQPTSEATPDAGHKIDRRAALETVDGNETVLKEITDLFLEESPRTLAALREGLAGGKAEEVRRAAHTLKGEFRIFGASTAADYALQIELHAREGDLDVEPLVAALEQEMQLLRPQLAELSHSIPGGPSDEG